MNKLKFLMDRILSVVCVKRCIACGELLEYDREEGLCPQCAEAWDEAKRTVCDRCYEMQSKCKCGFGKRYVDSVRHLALYDHTDRELVSNKIVYSLKKSNDNAVFEFVAKEMAELLIGEVDKTKTVVANVPRSSYSVRKYGYDHAKKLARKVAEKIGAEYVDILGHSGGKTEQKMLNKQQRELNAKNNCYIKPKNVDRIKGKTVLLIDDIGTTGAMTGVCAELLRKNGAVKVKCVLAAKNKLKKKDRKL